MTKINRNSVSCWCYQSVNIQMVTRPFSVCADKLGSWRRDVRLERLLMFDLIALVQDVA